MAKDLPQKPGHRCILLVTHGSIILAIVTLQGGMDKKDYIGLRNEDMFLFVSRCSEVSGMSLD